MPALAQNECASRPEYRNLRYEENWQYLADPACRTGRIDQLKFIALDAQGGRHLSLGGEARLRYEFVHNGAFGGDPEDANGYFLKRYLAHADVQAGGGLRAFVQLQSANESGRRGGPRREDEDDVDLNQGFVDWTPYRAGDDHVTLRAGRQELEFGLSRLLSTREGLNTRQSFDGLRSFGRLGRWNYNTTLVRPVETLPGAFDDRAEAGGRYAGASVWTANPLLPDGNTTVYANHRRKRDVPFDIGRGTDLRNTFGIRFWSVNPALDYNWEGGVQRGNFEGLAIRAWYFASDTGYTFAGRAGRPRLGLRVDATSGDRDPNDGELNTFNALFASTAYSGLAGQLGPANAIDVAPSLSFSPRPNLRVTLGAIGFWRMSPDDGIYSATGSLRRDGQSSSARHIGNQFTAQLVATPTRNWTLLATLAYFEAGRFLEESPPSEDVTYFTAWAAFRF